MKVKEILNKKRSFSIEVFPPKLESPIEPVLDTIDKLGDLNADFVSVTYGAGGTNKGRNNEVCQHVIARNDNLVSHFTSIGNTKEDVVQRIQRYVNMGGENLLALRGDYPKGWTGTGGDYKHGTELIEDIKKNFPNLCVGGACYPEKHFEGISLESDVKIMKLKEELGAEFFVTQLCYDLDNYKKFMDIAEKENVKSPILVGLLPVFGKGGVLRITSENQCNIPKELQLLIDKYESAEDFKKAGIEYTKKLIEDYLNLGVDGIHIYTMNKSKDIRDIILDTGLNKLK